MSEPLMSRLMDVNHHPGMAVPLSIATLHGIQKGTFLRLSREGAWLMVTVAKSLEADAVEQVRDQNRVFRIPANVVSSLGWQVGQTLYLEDTPEGFRVAEGVWGDATPYRVQEGPYGSMRLPLERQTLARLAWQQGDMVRIRQVHNNEIEVGGVPNAGMRATVMYVGAKLGLYMPARHANDLGLSVEHVVTLAPTKAGLRYRFFPFAPRA